MHQVGTSSLLIYMMHGHTYIKKELCIKLVIWKSLYYDAWSEKHQIMTVGCTMSHKNIRYTKYAKYPELWQYKYYEDFIYRLQVMFKHKKFINMVRGVCIYVTFLMLL